MKLLYIKDSLEEVNGASIYDKKLIDELRLYCDVTVFSLRTCDNYYTSLPLWKRKIKEEDVINLCALYRSSDKVLVSHEVIFDVCKYLPVDLIIIHNLFSAFESPWWFRNMYYRLGSKKYYSKALTVANRVLCLSFREANILRSMKVRYYPPGVNTSFDSSDNPTRLTYSTNSTYNWSVKRMSRLSTNEMEYLNQNFDFLDDGGYGQIGIIEDRFIVGFKLKLIQMLYSCEFIFSMVDLRTEIEAMGLDSSCFWVVSSTYEIPQLISSLEREEVIKIKVRNRIVLRDHYGWKNVAKKVLDLLDAKSD